MRPERVRLAHGLTVAGGAVFIVFGVLALAVVTFVFGFAVGNVPPVAAGFGALAALFVGIFPIVLGVLALVLARRVRERPDRDTAILLIVLGAVGLVAGGTIGGVLVLAAGVLLILEEQQPAAPA